MEHSLYERVDGIDAITAVARAFEERAAKGRPHQSEVRVHTGTTADLSEQNLAEMVR